MSPRLNTSWIHPLGSTYQNFKVTLAKGLFINLIRGGTLCQGVKIKVLRKEGKGSEITKIMLYN